MQSITALDIVVATYISPARVYFSTYYTPCVYWIGHASRTGSIDEIRIMLVREQRIRKLSKELFQEASYTVDVVEEVLRVCEIDLGRIYISDCILELGQ